MPNPLLEYRKTQRKLREIFDPFTASHCAACPTPCCRQPARIAPTDILLAEAAGWRPPNHGSTDAASAAAGEAAAALTAAGDPEGEGEPCRFLGERGCSFPHDLRPFGCTTFICRYMYQDLEKSTLERARRLVRILARQHDELMKHAAAHAPSPKPRRRP
ncbi:MAG: hypothetical protein KGJ62_10275 [Armatimonadetes bacterium]|nr:hypothetical protein [Armatimonadota bacterium]MDE2207815.1 hypothetical protein [Armatimonadota bacterium]